MSSTSRSCPRVPPHNSCSALNDEDNELADYQCLEDETGQLDEMLPPCLKPSLTGDSYFLPLLASLGLLVSELWTLAPFLPELVRHLLIFFAAFRTSPRWLPLSLEFFPSPLASSFALDLPSSPSACSLNLPIPSPPLYHPPHRRTPPQFSSTSVSSRPPTPTFSSSSIFKPSSSSPSRSL